MIDPTLTTNINAFTIVKKIVVGKPTGTVKTDIDAHLDDLVDVEVAGALENQITIFDGDTNTWRLGELDPNDFTITAGASTTDKKIITLTHPYYDADSFDDNFADKTTDDLTEGDDNLYYTDERSRESMTVKSVGTHGELEYDNDTGILTFIGQTDNEVWDYYTGGIGVDVDAGVISIGQDVDTDSEVTFAELNVSGSVKIQNVSMESETRTQLIDVQFQVLSFDAAKYSAAKIVIIATQSNKKHISEVVVIHDGVEASASEFGVVTTHGELSRYDVDLAGGKVRLLAKNVTQAETTYTAAITLFDL